MPCVTVNLSDKSIVIVAAAHVAEPQDLEEALKKFAKVMEQDRNFPGVKFNAAEHAGVKFHTTTIKVPQDEKVAKILGDKLDVAVGIGPKSAYLAVGPDSLKLCQSLIDKSKAEASKKVSPLRVDVSMASVFKFAAAVQGDADTTARCARPGEVRRQGSIEGRGSARGRHGQRPARGSGGGPATAGQLLEGRQRRRRHPLASAPRRALAG